MEGKVKNVSNEEPMFSRSIRSALINYNYQISRAVELIWHIDRKGQARGRVGTGALEVTIHEHAAALHAESTPTSDGDRRNCQLSMPN
jgi:hypothetical protein